ncbi:unnamed protein product [Paramecium sonneborni]|uniref:Uncharacterized protein n=1 Tax=Paramecium sonneborni TaxID=65129 RepID=A0A8S1RQ24_9CILI|nr:unnamed protein product [Paramecium sonneborni]
MNSLCTLQNMMHDKKNEFGIIQKSDEEKQIEFAIQMKILQSGTDYSTESCDQEQQITAVEYLNKLYLKVLESNKLFNKHLLIYQEKSKLFKYKNNSNLFRSVNHYFETKEILEFLKFALEDPAQKNKDNRQFQQMMNHNIIINNLKINQKQSFLQNNFYHLMILILQRLLQNHLFLLKQKLMKKLDQESQMKSLQNIECLKEKILIFIEETCSLFIKNQSKNQNYIKNIFQQLLEYINRLLLQVKQKMKACIKPQLEHLIRKTILMNLQIKQFMVTNDRLKKDLLIYPIIVKYNEKYEYKINIKNEDIFA